MDASGETTPYPAFFDAHGAGITVDNNGVLHYVTTVVPGYSSHPDSLFYLYSSSDNVLDYGFSFEQFNDLDKPYIYDFTTSGNGNWDSRFIGILYTRNIQDDDVVPNPAAWTTDGTTPLDYNSRIRVSRSNDGTKLFYSWTDGDTTNVVSGPPNTYHANTNPSFFYKGYDVVTDMFTPTSKIDAFDAPEAGFYCSYVSPIAMPSANGYILPATFLVSQAGDLNATNSVDYYFMNDMEVANSSYNETIYTNGQGFCGWDPWSINEIPGTAILSVQSFPNPFNTSATLKVSLNKNEKITLNVMNNIGQVVFSKSQKGTPGVNELIIDGENLDSGIYFYVVKAGNSKATGKIAVSK